VTNLIAWIFPADRFAGVDDALALVIGVFQGRSRRRGLGCIGHEKEIFASEVVSVGVVHGNIVITLANVRVGELIEGQSPKARRIVCGRIVLTNPAAGQLMNSLQRLGAQMEAAAKPPPSQKPS
jgi:hypothetical protein